MSEETLDLNSVASDAMGESKPQETTESTQAAVTPEKTETVSKVEKPAVQATTQSQPTLSRRQAAAKEAADFRAQAEKERAEWNKERQGFLEKIKQFDPLMPYANDIAKAIQEQKQQELAQKYQQNPDQKIQDMINQAIQPYQQQMQEAQLDQFTNQSLNHIKTLAGSDETYQSVSPYMKQFLDSVIQSDPEGADKLARNPELLFRIARDIYREQNEQVQTQQQQQQVLQNQKSKAEAAKFNGGISKPNRFAKAPMSPTRETAKQNAYDFIKELTGQNK